jgi:c-di-GMP-binding flagellar brake protein YcgR
MARERRRFPRVRESFTIQYRVASAIASSWCRGPVINLSAGGMRFRCVEEPLEVGAPLSIQVSLPGFREPLILKAVVVWSQLQASGVTEVGAEFQDLDVKQQLMIDRLVSFLRMSF